MTNPRKGLIRQGYRTYLVPTQDGRTFAIDRDAPRRFFVRPQDWPRNGFFAFKFARLTDALAYIRQAPVFNDNYPYPEVPQFLRRWKPEVRA